MRAFTYTVHIDRPPDAVFDFMMDFSNASRWRNLVREIQVLTPGPLRVGSELLITLDVMGGVRKAVSEVWAYDRPRHVGLRNTAQNVTGAFEYRLEPEGNGTKVSFSCDIRPHGWMWLALPLMLKGDRMRYRDQLGILKRVVEEQPLTDPVTRS